MATPVTMQGVALTPAGGARGATVLIDLVIDPGQAINAVGFIDSDDYEVIGQVAITANEDTGVWSTLLYANADIRPAGTYYRARYIVDGIEHPALYFNAVPGGGWIGDHLIIQPGNIPDGAPSGRQIAYQKVTTAPATSSDSLADATGLALSVPVAARPVTVEFYAPYVTSSVADSQLIVTIYDVTGSAEIARTVTTGSVAGGAMAPVHLLAPLDPLPATGVRDYKVQFARGGAAGGTRTLAGSVFTPLMMRALEY